LKVVVYHTDRRISVYVDPLLRTARRSRDPTLIRPRRPWRTIVEVELATDEWVHWFNLRRLYEYCGDIPPVELETACRATRQHADPRHGGCLPRGNRLSPPPGTTPGCVWSVRVRSDETRPPQRPTGTTPVPRACTTRGLVRPASSSTRHRRDHRGGSLPSTTPAPAQHRWLDRPLPSSVQTLRPIPAANARSIPEPHPANRRRGHASESLSPKARDSRSPARVRLRGIKSTVPRSRSDATRSRFRDGSGDLDLLA
jgi:hypothetical protein